MTILDTIVARKKQEIAENKQNRPLAELEKSKFFTRDCLSFKGALLAEGSSGIIAEFKRKSPSKDVINATADVVETTKGYANAGAAALSVLTDVDFFNGSNENLIKARTANTHIPILRKDFIVDEYQIVEAKAIGADVILLIAAILTPEEVKTLTDFAHSLGLQVLLELHEEAELGHVNAADVVGINNRNLKDFSVNVQTSFDLGAKLPSEMCKISESAISETQTIRDLKQAGFNGFLIGETFMKENDPALACKRFVEALR